MVLKHESDEVRIYHLVEQDYTPMAGDGGLTARDVHALLSGAAASGVKFSGTLILICGIAALIGLPNRPHIPMVVSGCLGAALFFALRYHLKRKTQLAAKVAYHPDLVEWAHPCVLCTGQQSPENGHNYIRVYFSNKNVLEVPISRERMEAVFSWLKKQNSKVRLSH